MTNPKNRRTFPGGERPADRRPGCFKPGHKKRGGRKRGTPNANSADFRRAVVEVADRIGMGGNGEQGVVGYLRFLARYHAPTFMRMLGRLLAWEFLEGDAVAQPQTMPTIEQVSEWARQYARIEGGLEPKSTLRGTLQSFTVDELMQCAVEDPKAFGKLLTTALLPPPTARDRRRAWEQSRSVRD